jgi:hypothetical protein
MSHWLGIKKKIWHKGSIIKFVKALSPVLSSLEPSELLSIIQQNNISLPSLPNDFLPRKALEMALGGNSGEAIEIIGDIESYDIDEEQGDIVSQSFDEQEFDHKISIQDIDTYNSLSLPNLDVNDLFQAVDHIEKYRLISDKDTVDFLVNKKVTQLWNIILNTKNPLHIIDKITDSPNSDYEYQKTIRNTFIEEYKSTINLPTPQGYQFKVDK